MEAGSPVLMADGDGGGKMKRRTCILVFSCLCGKIEEINYILIE
jgi:hypothetical protein